MDSDERGAEIHVVVVPLLAQGHLNQLLHFSTAIAGRGLSVTFVATSTHIHQVRHRFQGWDLQKFNIRFEELPIPELPDGEPSAQNTRMFPIHLASVFDCGDLLRPQMDNFLCKICSYNNKSVVMVYDMHMGWVQPLADKYEIPAYKFIPVGIYPALWFTDKRIGTEFAGLGFSSLKVPLFRTITEQHLRFLEHQESFLGPDKGTILNSFPEIEAPFIDLAKERKVFGDNPVWTVGPLLPLQLSSEDLPMELRTDCDCTRWLDNHPPASVLYVSFGSVSSLPTEQIQEVAVGLERSGQPFVWVLRSSDTSRFSVEANSNSNGICEFLPEGYESRIRGRGFIATNWAPQLEILFHNSTGGFLTHCGWNSTVESICAGVPIVAWPLHSDQFAKAKLLACELKIGVEMKEWSNTEKYEMVSAKEVQVAVKRLMVSEEGTQMRKRAQDLRAQTRMAIADGGSSSDQFDSLIDHFSQQSRRSIG
ncbi:zeatin O-xylosyltransferase-like [Cryptomeria japonica]|uniref:zeatin O-xylosyltransferase-like n=1 Tax=Cryptomeria japonica TaxID=3369 RepID=UPI0027DAA2DE|nr:zeatin O-xylosyltransferase-like [Cryptomeria japonica]